MFSSKQIKDRYQVKVTGEETIRLGVAVALINVHNEILLERRSDCGWWGVTGGKLDVGEIVKKCAQRELREETGILIEPDKLEFIDIFSNPREGRILQYPDNRVHLVDIVYLYMTNECKFIKSSESLELKYFPIKNIPEKIVPPAIEPLNRIRSRLK